MRIDFERRCWAEIDLDKLHANFKLIRSRVPTAEIMAVVKANAYGHGDLVAARELQAAGADRFGVSGLAEAVRLRHGGITRPILVFGYTSPAHVSQLAVHHIDQCIFSPGYALQLSQAAQVAGVWVKTHLKVDTGMGRLGFNAKDDPEGAVQQLCQAYDLPGLRPRGLFTHFPCADSALPADVAYTEEQFRLFGWVREQLAAQGKTFRYFHCCNSAGMVAYPQMQLDIVRPGIILYGCNPSPEVALPGLQPAFKLKTVVTMVKTLQKGDSVSYGRIFTAPRDMRVATLAVGYADGYPRLLSGSGVVGIRGCPAPLVGRVCMDQTIADVTAIPGAQLGDIATVFGGEGADSIDEVAAKSGTINYETLCNIGRRVQRVYTENGSETTVADYMED